MGNVASTCDQVVAFVIAYKWAIISILVVLVILSWVCFGKKWSNVLKVFCAGTFSIVIFDILFNWFEFYSKDSIDTLSAGFWNFIILIVSAPVAFAIWHFRDENNKQQIENQRKDINLKEFQKLSDIEYEKYSSKEIISIFRNKMQERFDPAKEFSDLIVFSFIRVISKNLVEELYPLSCLLEIEFSLTADLN